MIEKKPNSGFGITIWCFLVAIVLIIYNSGGTNMKEGSLVAIAVALFGGALGLWRQIVIFKKDAQRIDSVNKIASEVKVDTTKMEPSVNRIENIVNFIKENLIGKILPKIDKLDGIDEILKDIEFKNRIEQKVSSAVVSPSYILSAVDLVYKENARLNIENEELKTMLQDLKQENILLEAKSDELKSKLNKYRNRYEGMER